jgi:hypothetical protein
MLREENRQPSAPVEDAKMRGNAMSWSGSLLLACLAMNAPDSARNADVPGDFGAGVYKHVEHLASFGDRRAGSVNEGRAIEYVSNQLQEAGLEVKVEPYLFDCFEWSAAELQVGESSYLPEVIGFNPYEDDLTHAGEMVLLDPDLPDEQFEKLDLEGASIVTVKTESPVTYFRLLAKTPKLIVLLEKGDYQEVAQAGTRHFMLQVSGSLRRYHSANVIGILSAPRPTVDEIIISAHLDSYKDSPGADDNGTGVGVMIELARYFARLQDGRSANLKFVAFGAEEVGMLGARIYLARHETDLKNNRLVFNIDRVGGSGRAVVEALGGITGIPARQGSSQIPDPIADKSWEGLESCWSLNAPDVVPLMRASNRPPWLVDVIRDSIDEAGLQVVLAGNLGGDSLAFSQAGMVASGMAIGGNPVHSPNDVPSRIDIQSLENCGLLVSTLLLKVMAERPWRSSAGAAAD